MRCCTVGFVVLRMSISYCAGFPCIQRNQKFIWILSCGSLQFQQFELKQSCDAYLNSKFDLHHYTFQVGIRITLLFAMLFCQLRHDFSCDLVDPCHSSIRPRLGCGCFLIDWICLQLQVRSRECHACSPPGEAFGEHVFLRWSVMVRFGNTCTAHTVTYQHLIVFNIRIYSIRWSCFVQKLKALGFVLCGRFCLAIGYCLRCNIKSWRRKLRHFMILWMILNGQLWSTCQSNFWTEVRNLRRTCRWWRTGRRLVIRRSWGAIWEKIWTLLYI